MAATSALFLAAVLAFSLHSRPLPLLFAATPASIRNPPQGAGIANYARDEVDTFYTYPEWYIVWSYQAKADFQQSHLPSDYSYFGDIRQYWQAYSCAYAAARRPYPFAIGDHIMLVVIGSSFTLEYALKGLYEETVGRASEWTSGRHTVDEDKFAAKVAENYAAFVHMRPFYEFSFANALRGLWRETPFRTTHVLRSVERRIWLSLDYAMESIYCQLIQWTTHLTYGFEDINTSAWIVFPAGERSRVIKSLPQMKVAREIGPTEAIVEIPRYQEFTADAQLLMHEGVHFREIAGNELIVISAIAPRGWTNSLPDVQLLLSQPLLNNPTKTRTVLLTRVPDLDELLPSLTHQGLEIEHLYDY